MHRRAFLCRCGVLAAAGIFAASVLAPDQRLWAAGVSVQSSRQMTSGDRALLRMLSTDSADAYF